MNKIIGSFGIAGVSREDKEAVIERNEDTQTAISEVKRKLTGSGCPPRPVSLRIALI